MTAEPTLWVPIDVRQGQDSNPLMTVDFADGEVSPSHTSTRYAVLSSPDDVCVVSSPQQGANPVRGIHSQNHGSCSAH